MAKHFKPEKKKSGFRIFLKIIGCLLLLIVILVAGMIGFLSATEFKPDDRMTLETQGEATAKMSVGEPFRIVTWNIGYGALGDNADFFMDGGSSVYTADTERVNSNMESVIRELGVIDPDIMFLQEVDQDSDRSHHINELEILREIFTDYTSSFANNFKVAYLPYPIPPMGKVDSGIATFSEYPVSGAERIQLPIPFKWPIRMANLKRCLLETRVKVEGTDKELVLMNLHLEAYDNGEGKIAQTNMLADLLEAETEKGNYVIAGGDFNQIFSTEDGMRFLGQPGKWQAGKIYVDQFEGIWQFMMDADVPSCRSLDQPYLGADHEKFQYYLIDGFIVSDNIRVDFLETQDLEFEVSDHNPIVMDVTLKK